VARRYPELRALGAAIGARDMVLDGEIVTFDAHGRPSFERLQRRMHVDSDSAIRRLQTEVPAVYILFDLLWLDGHSLMHQPYESRRTQLLELGLTGPSWQTPPHELGDGATTIEVSRSFGIEGVVAKRLDSIYETGKRSKIWVKVKNTLRQEFVVGGWLPGEGNRDGTIGSLLVGYWDHSDGEPALHYAGRVGSGLSQAHIAELERCFEQYARDTSPFATGKPPKQSRFVEPLVVVEVKFTEWTQSGTLRQPTYLGYRTDKDASEVVRET
jgi:bifunctional non-homologous end joining protein LigD